MEAKHAATCLDDFVKLRGPLSVRGCIHHTDNGSQYNCGKYKDKLAGYGILISRSTQCKENGSSEQSHHVSKNMYLEPLGLKTFAQLKKACKDFMYKNNYKRAIKQLGWKTPFQFEEVNKRYTRRATTEKEDARFLAPEEKWGDLERHKRIKIYK
ncbi:MAG: hypothetical protein M9911_10250 [Saprospiraceae bacterium]|nr:hypothetical protein [Saprospiraceae bacterium]